MAQRGEPLHVLPALLLTIRAVEREHIGSVTPQERHLPDVVILRVLARLEPHRAVPAIIDGDANRVIALAADIEANPLRRRPFRRLAITADAAVALAAFLLAACC